MMTSEVWYHWSQDLSSYHHSSSYLWTHHHYLQWVQCHCMWYQMECCLLSVRTLSDHTRLRPSNIKPPVLSSAPPPTTNSAWSSAAGSDSQLQSLPAVHSLYTLYTPVHRIRSEIRFYCFLWEFPCLLPINCLQNINKLLTDSEKYTKSLYLNCVSNL